MKILIVFLFLTSRAFANEGLPLCKVLEVLDGDTVNVSCGDFEVSIRVAALDTPETKKKRKKFYAQPLGGKATLEARKFLGEKVYIKQPEKWSDRTGHYGRQIARIQNSEGEDLSEYLVSKGLAFVNKKYVKDDLKLLDLYSKAQRLKVGVWGFPEECQMRPWKWRKHKKKKDREPVQKIWRKLGCLE